MSDRIPERSSACPHHEVLEEHRALQQVIARLERTRGPHELLAKLNEFRELMRRHFTVEMEPGGLYDTIREMAPRHTTTLQRLAQEHEALLRSIDALAARTRACIEGPLAGLRQAVAELVRDLRAHEHRETDVLSDAVYTDTGFGG